MKTDDLPIWYEPHPVSPERKLEITSQGYRIIDAVFDPARTEPPPPMPLDQMQRTEPPPPMPLDQMQRAELAAALRDRGLPSTGKLEDMRERLRAEQ